MFDPIIISYGKGQLPAFLGNPDTPMDVVSMTSFSHILAIKKKIISFELGISLT